MVLDRFVGTAQRNDAQEEVASSKILKSLVRV